MRGVSTVLDVTLCLLLVSAAAVVLTHPMADPATTDRTVEETATLLGTTTAEVEYTIPPGPETRSEDVAWVYDRHRHGTLAGLVARSAIANATLDGQQVTPTADPFQAGVRTELREVLPARTSVTARWTPYPGAPLSGRFTVGQPPPAGAEVQSATLTVPAPELAPNIRTDNGTPLDYEPVGQKLAEPIVEAFLPDVAEIDPGDERLVFDVTRRTHVLTGESQVPVERWIRIERHGRLEETVTDALAERFEADLRERYETPRAAREMTSSGTVHLVVRRWSA